MLRRLAGLVTAGLVAGFALVPQVTYASGMTATLIAQFGGPGHASIYPSGMEVAPDGTIVGVDTGNDQIVTYTAGGSEQWRVGSFGAAHLQFAQPRDAGVDSAGNIYVADEGNSRVVKLTSAGRWVAAFKGPAGDKIGPPIGLSVSNDTLYVADPNHLRVHVLDTSGNEIRFISSNGACTIGRLRDVDADAAGNVYVANYDKNNILKFSPTGTCITSWGTKGIGNGQFKNPYGVRIGFDPVLGVQAVYVADSNNDRVQEFLTDGTYEAQLGGAGMQPGTFTQLRRVAVAMDGSGDVWGADLWGYRLERFHRTAAGYTYAQTIGGTPPPLLANAVFNQARAIDFDSAGNVYTMDTVNQRVVEWTPTGSIIRACGQRGFTSTGDFNWPRGLAVDPATGQIWIADTKQSDIQILGADCSPIAKFGVAGSGPKNFNWPYSIAIRQSDGTAWIADTRNNRVLSYSVSTRQPISSLGGFNQPGGISVMPGSGHLLVADTKNNAVVELSDTNGSAITVVRTLTDGFSKPEGVAADTTGHIYVADSVHSRIVVLNPDGTEAGVISGGLNQPEDVSVDTAGNLWVSDTYNDRVLEYSVSFSSLSGGSVPQYVGDLLGPGTADMYPVDIAHTSTDYYVLDPGRFRIVEVDRATGAIVNTAGGTQGSGPGQIGDARAIALDAEGDVWVADTPNNRVEEFDSNLNFLMSFGSTGDLAGQFRLDYGIAIGQGLVGGNPAEVIYVSDGSARIQKFDMNGAHVGTFSSSDLSQPRQMALDPATDNLLVVNAGKSIVDVFDNKGNELYTIGSAGKGPGQFSNEPRGVYVTNDGHVFVTDAGGQRIEEFLTDGTYLSTIGGPSEFVGPRGITITENNILAVTDEWDFAIKEYSLAGTKIRTLFGKKPPMPGVNSPRGVRVDSAGRISVMDYWNQRVESVDPSGQNVQVFGFRGRRSLPGSINFAWDLAFQPTTGRIFVANRESNDIVVFNADGSFVTKWSRAGHKNGQVMLPQGVSFAPDGTLLVADSGNGRIERFSIDATGKGTWMATYGTQGLSTQGPSFLNHPTGISVAADGTIWVADTLNGSIQSMSPTGTWTRFSRTTGQSFRVPWGVTVAPDGSIWVADTGHNQIAKMTSSGTMVFTATGTQMGAGPLNGPSAIAFGNNGHVYVTDTWNNRVIDLQMGA